MSKRLPSPRRGRAYHTSVAAFVAVTMLAVASSSFLAHRATGADSSAAGSKVVTSQGKYSVAVPGGLAFSEFKGYEAWQTVSISRNGNVVALILGNSVMIDAYKAGIPQNGKPFPDGAKLAKVHWNQKPSQFFPIRTVPATLRNVDFMEKDSKRFAQGGGWGYAAFDYQEGSDTFAPATATDQPPQAHDATCGVACHTVAKSRDYVFTEYVKR